MSDYYSEKLSSQRLRLCYELAPPRVQRYLEAEVEFVLDRIKSTDAVLELGCGYGRVIRRIATKAHTVVGIDTSRDSLKLALKSIDCKNCHLLEMNAVALGFKDRQFDGVICIQNGISAFKVARRTLVKEAVRVTRPGGTVLFSSYSPRFWKARLEWFQIQADHGLIGEIDPKATKDGVIVCKDGFRATTIGPEDFHSLTSGLGVSARTTEVNGSCIFCEMTVM